MSDTDFDPYYTWLGIPPEERPITYYRLLGIAPFEENPEVISNAVDQRMGHIRTFQTGRRANFSQRMLNELSSASICLLNPEKKADYDRRLRQSGQVPQANKKDKKPPVDFISPHEQVRVIPRDYGDEEELKLEPAAPRPSLSVATLERDIHRPASLDPELTETKVDPKKLTLQTLTAADLPYWFRPSYLIVGAISTAIALGFLVVLFLLASSKPEASDAARVPFAVVELQNDTPRNGANANLPGARPSDGAKSQEQPKASPAATDPSSESSSGNPDGVDSATNPEPTPAGPADDAGAATTGQPAQSQEEADKEKADEARQDAESTPAAPEASLARNDLYDEGLAELEVMPAQPLPEAGQIDAASVAARALYRRQLAEADTSDKLAKLADQLFEEARLAEGTAAEHYAMLDLAANLASRSGHYRKAWTILNETEKQFRTVLVAQKAEALRKAAKRLEAPNQIKMASKGWIQLVEQAVIADEYELAREYAIEANRMALKYFNKDFRKYVNVGLDAVQELLAASKDLESDRQAYLLQAFDADAAKTARWGRFLCEYKNDWRQGLPLWQRGDDAGAQLAALDAQFPQNAAEQELLGDRWWEASLAAKDILPRRFYKTRASRWYRMAHPQSAGIARNKMELRLKDVEQAEFAYERGKAIGLLEIIDPEASGRSGWLKRGERLGIVNARSQARAPSGVVPEGRYELQAIFTRSAGEGSFGIQFPVGLERHARVVLGNQAEGGAGLESIDHRRAFKNETTQPDPVLNGQEHYLRIHVNVVDEDVRIYVRFDGRDFVDWRGKRDSLLGNSSQKEGVGVFTEAGNTLVFERLQLSFFRGEALPTLE